MGFRENILDSHDRYSLDSVKGTDSTRNLKKNGVYVEVEIKMNTAAGR